MKRAFLAMPALLLPLCLAQAQEGAVKPKLPWDAAAVQQAWAWGMVLTYDFEQAGKPSGQVRFEFTDEGNGEISRARFLVTEKGEQATERRRFMMLQDHLDSLAAGFQDAETSSEELTIGEKKYACTKFRRKQGEGASAETRIAWFAKEIPGLWVKVTHENAAGSESYTLAGSSAMFFELGWNLSEIPGALKNGLTVKYKVTEPNKTVSACEFTYSACNNAGCTETITYFDKDGKQSGEAVVGKLLWSHYRRTFMFAVGTWRRAEKTIDAAGRKFECYEFSLEEQARGSTQTTTMAVSRKHPGIVVERTITVKNRDGEFKTVIELSEFKVEK